MNDIYKLLDIMATLRDPQRGCPWDLEQDFGTIVPYTIEEAYEVADAIERGDLPALKDELGDLLLQVVFHARLAEESGAFSFADVAAGICDKLIRRHPHVFGDAIVDSAAAQRTAWEEHKAKEQNRMPGGGARALAGVSHALPALARAAKLGRRAAVVGFDWQNSDGVIDKLREELMELQAARTSGRLESVREELGDALFALANVARHLDVDPEEALRLANRKFEQRFEAVEDRVRDDGRAWRDFSSAELDDIWQIVKRQRAQP
jgi:MazG family protein